LPSTAVADSRQRSGGLLQPVVLVNQWAQLLEPRLDLLTLLVQKISH
jgi:hypothetical protein